MAWLNEQWNKPSRTDHYLMRIAQRVQQQWCKTQVSLKDQIIEFERKVRPPLDPVARSKAIWMGGVKAAQAQQAQDQREDYGN